MQPLRTMAFVDAGQLRPAIISNRIQQSSNKKFDWSKFKSVLDRESGGEVFDIHYFDCVSDEPSEGRESFHLFLENQLSFKLHFADLKEKRRNCPECKHQYFEHEQKGVDVRLATQMCVLGYSNAYDQAILVSGDGDYADLVSHLRNNLGKRIKVMGWDQGIAPALREEAHSVTHLETVLADAFRNP